MLIRYRNSTDNKEIRGSRDTSQFFKLGCVPDLPSLHRHKVGVYDLQVVGTQWTATINPGQTQNWFTHSWPADWFVQWSIRPTTPGGKIKWDVAIERAANNTFTYWITVTNIGSVATNFEGKYAILK